MAKPLTVATIKAKAQQPRAHAEEEQDGAVTGGRVQYWPSGAVSYLLRYRFRTKSKKLVIGKFNPDANELAEVRKKAREAQN